MDSYTLSEFLTVILNRVAERRGEANRLLPQNPSILHKAFYEMSPKYSESFPSLKQLHFITAGAFPYSPDLTEVLDLLQFSGSISRENPSFEKFSLKQYTDTSEWLQEETARLTEGDEQRRAKLNEMIEDLAMALH